MCPVLRAQIVPFTIEPVKKADFSPTSPVISPETDAVILDEKGETVIDADADNGYFTSYHYFRRLLILNKSGLSMATDRLGFNKKLNGTSLSTLRISTYNLEKGEIKVTKIPKEDLFVEDPKKDFLKLKFAYPAAKVGSILEIEYWVKRYSRDLMDWYFQQSQPVLRSSYTACIPENWNFVVTLQNKKYLSGIIRDSQVNTITSFYYTYKDLKVYITNWKFENVPPMVDEPFTSTIKNYIGCIKFQLSVEPIRPGLSETFLTNWTALNNTLSNSPNFGIPIAEPDRWAQKLAKTIVQPEDPDLEKAKKIYSWVRDHYKAEYRSWGLTHASLEDASKSAQITTGEINLLLIALLKTQNLTADGVILATRDNGFTNVEYPVMDNFNYSICRLVLGGKIYLLDASSQAMGFGKLPSYCYNGQARVIDGKPPVFFLSPDSLRESSNIYVNIENDPSGKFLNVDWNDHPGYYSSTDIRDNISKNGEDEYKKSYLNKNSFTQVDSFMITGLKDLDHPLSMNFQMRVPVGSDDHFYFSPMLNSGLAKNPFTSAERNYPVEFPFIFDDTYVMNMEIPEGYEVEELPKGTRVKLGENDGLFEFMIQKNDHSIMLKSFLNIKKATFDPEDYNSIRDFYAFVVKKQSEQIIFRKIKK